MAGLGCYSKIDTAFSLPNEEKGKEDSEGTFVDGAERSILNACALNKNNVITDTLENINEPGFLLHGQKRKIVYNEKYMTGSRIEFKVVTTKEDSGKVYIESKTNTSAILVDTSVTVDKWFMVADEYLNTLLIRRFEIPGITRRIGLKDANNGKFEVWCDNIVGISIETDQQKLLSEDERDKIDIVLRSKGGVKIYKSKDKTNQIFPDKNNLLNASKEGNDYVTTWSKYSSVFLTQDTIFASIEPGRYGEFEIIARYKNLKQEHKKETAIILDVPKIESIEFVSGHKDVSGNNIIRKAEHYMLKGISYKGSEWIAENNFSYPFSHTAGESVSINLGICFPKVGQYEISGVSDVNGMNFYKDIEINKNKKYFFNIISDNKLDNNLQKIDDVHIDWRVSILEKGEKICIDSCITKHTIYILYDKPKLLTAFNDTNFITDIRLNKCFELILSGYNTDKDSIAKSIKTQLESQLYYTRGIRDLVHMSYIWFLFDQKPSSPNKFGAQCNEFAVLFETILKSLGFEATYYQVLPSAEDGIIRLWNNENRIPVAWYLNNNDSTFHHPEDEYQYDSVSGTIVNVNVLSERLLFWMGSWNEGEGSVYFNDKMYPMLYSYTYVANGETAMQAARNMLVLIDSLDCVRPEYLQMWRVLYKYNNVYGTSICKNPTGYYVEIPEL